MRRENQKLYFKCFTELSRGGIMVTGERCGRWSVCMSPHMVCFASVGRSDVQVIRIGEQHLCLADSSLSFNAPQNLSSYPSPFLFSPLQLSHSEVFYLSKYIFPTSDFELPPAPTIHWFPSSIDRKFTVCVWLCGLVYENKHTPLWSNVYFLLCVCYRLSEWSFVLLGHPYIHLVSAVKSSDFPF